MQHNNNNNNDDDDDDTCTKSGISERLTFIVTTAGPMCTAPVPHSTLNVNEHDVLLY